MQPIPFARRFEGVTGSAIRDIFKMISQPGMISFAGGNPLSAALPDSLLADISREVLQRDGKRLLQYGPTEGWPTFRTAVAQYLTEAVGIAAEEGHILPVTGSTQAVDLLLKALIDEGDVILVEGPTFLGSLQAMKLYGARLVPVEMDEEGIRLDLLTEAIRAHKPKMLYVVPNFQNPTGVTMSLERRKAIARLAAEHNFIVAEDDPYRGLRYRGAHLPCIYAFDEAGRVVYLTSFSKLISPGIRVGAMVCRDADLLRKLTIGKQSTDCHSPNMTQAMVAEYLSQGHLPAQLEMACACYREQLARMEAGLAGFPSGTKATSPEGGLFLFVTLPEGYDAAAILKKAVEKGVAYVPGTHFYAGGGHENTLRLNFSNSEPALIDKGMAILADVVRRHGMDAAEG